MKRKIEKVYFSPSTQIGAITYAPITVALCNDATLWAHALGGGDDSWVSYPPIPQPKPDRVNCDDCKYNRISDKGERTCTRTGPPEHQVYFNQVECVFFEPKDGTEPVKVDCEDCQFGTWQTIVESGGEIPITQRACDHPARMGPVEGWLPIVCSYFTAVGK